MKTSKEFIIGCIVVLTLGLFFVTYNFLNGGSLFDKGYQFYVIFDNLGDIDKSRSVKLSGAKIGHVSEIITRRKTNSLYPEFIIKLKINKKYKSYISDSSIASVESGGLTGNPFVNIELAKGKQLNNNDTLKTKGLVTGGMLDKMEPTQQKIDAVMVSLNETLLQLKNILDDENQGNIKVLIKEFSNVAANTNKILINNEKNLEHVLVSANKTFQTANTNLDKFGEVADKFNKIELKETIASYKKTSENLNQLLEKINKGEGTIGAFMNDKEIYNSLNRTSKNLEDLLKDFKENPKRYVQFSIFAKQLTNKSK